MNLNQHQPDMLGTYRFGRKSALTQTERAICQNLKCLINQIESALMQTDLSAVDRLKSLQNHDKSALTQIHLEILHTLCSQFTGYTKLSAKVL